MNILTIDTATEVLDVSVRTASGGFLELIMSDGLKHTERLLPVISSLLSDAGLTPNRLDLIVCSRGPGSFTGLRIGMATAKGLRQACGVPIVSVPTLDAIAYSYSWYGGTVIPVLDARKDRVYCATYESGVRTGAYLDIPVAKLRSCARSQMASMVTGISVDFTTQMSRQVPGSIGVPTRATGEAYASLGAALFTTDGPDATDFGPMYLRKSDAEEKLGAPV